MPFSTVIVVALGAGARRLTFSPSATAVAFSERLDVGMREGRDRPRDVRGVGGEVVDPLEPLDARLEHSPPREPVGEERVREDGAAVDVDAATLRDLDVVRDRVDDLRAAQRREALLDLTLERLHELLLPRDAVEVGVGVPVANVVERLRPSSRW